MIVRCRYSLLDVFFVLGFVFFVFLPFIALLRFLEDAEFCSDCYGSSQVILDWYRVGLGRYRCFAARIILGMSCDICEYAIAAPLKDEEYWTDCYWCGYR